MKKDTLAFIGSMISCAAIIYGLRWELAIVKALWGFWGAALALFLFPVTLTLVPWYMLFVYGNSQLLIFTYGGYFLGLLVGHVGCFANDRSDEHTEKVKPACEMKVGVNKIIAIYGIGTYIFSIITSASDIEGNPVFPGAIILISGIAGFLFFIMATIRLWKSARIVSIIYTLSVIILVILSVIQEITLPSYESPIIILCNIAEIIHFFAFVWAIIRLFKMEETGANVSHRQFSAISDYYKRVEVEPRNAGTYDNSGITHTKNQRILVIDDNPHIHKDWKQLFEAVEANSATEEQLAIFGALSGSAKDGGFVIDSAFQGQEGLDKIRQALQKEHPYIMAIVDMRMPPGWDGVRTIEHIWELCPDLHIIICAAYSDYTWPEIVERLGRSEKLVMLKYPFNDIEVHQFAIGIAEKVGCKLSARIERALKQMAECMRPRIANVQR